jgi:hypothetical protein
VGAAGGAGRTSSPARQYISIYLCRPDLVRYEYPQATFQFLFTLRINCYYFRPISVRRYLKLCIKNCFVPDETIYGPHHVHGPYVGVPRNTNASTHKWTLVTITPNLVTYQVKGDSTLVSEKNGSWTRVIYWGAKFIYCYRPWWR